MSLVLVVAPRAERLVVGLRRRLGALAAVVVDPDPDHRARQHATLIVLTGGGWGALRVRLLSWRAEGLDRPVILAPEDAPRSPDTRGLSPMVLAAPSILEEAVATALQERAPTRLRLRGAEVDLAHRTLTREGETSALSQQDARLLAFLSAREGLDLSREELLRGVWGYQRSVPTRAVDMAISRLRKKIEVDPGAPDHVLSNRGDGYRFVLALAASVASTRWDQPLTRFFGRGPELAELGERFGAGHRLVALVGPPGVGKTRLAREHARATGVPTVFAELGEAGGAPEVLATVARALDLTTSGLPAAFVQESVGRALAARGVRLLVLDNAEHLVHALAGPVLAWLGLAPELRVLLTSRVRPGLPGEVLREVAPLPPEDAAALFLDRAAAAGGPALRTDAGDLDAVLELLDRLPLALELAAARSRVLSLADLRRRLPEHLDLLAGGGGEARHATLRGALNWSWDLLEAPARALLTQLSAFSGSFSLDDVEAVAEGGMLSIPALLAGLVDQSLVQREATDGRYVLLHSVRSFAAARGETALLARARDSHARHFAARAARAVQALCGPRALQALDVVRPDLPNLSTAWEQTPAGRPEALADLTIALDALWTAHGTLDQRLDLLDRALDRIEPAGSSRARTLLQRAAALMPNGRTAQGERDLRLALASFLAVGDLRGAARTLFHLAASCRRRGLLGEAHEAVGQIRRLGSDDPLVGAMADIEGGFLVCLSGEDQAAARQARRQLARATSLALALGDHAVAVQGAMLTTTAHELAGDIASALDASGRFDAIAATRPDPNVRMVCTYQQIILAILLGRYAEAADRSARLAEDAAMRGNLSLARNARTAQAAALHGIGRNAEAHALWEWCEIECQRSAAPRIALSARAGLAIALLEEERLDELLELCEEGVRQASELGLGRVQSSLELYLGGARLLEGRPDLAAAVLAGINLDALRPEQIATLALLSAGAARARGLDTTEARALLERHLSGPAFAGKAAFSEVLSAFERGDADALGLYTLPPAPPSLRAAAARLMPFCAPREAARNP